MKYKLVEYSVVQLTEGAGWKWEVRFGDRKNKSGVTSISRAAAIKLAEYEIDRALNGTESKAASYRPVSHLVSLHQRLAAVAHTTSKLIAELRDVNQLREQVRRAQLTAQDRVDKRDEDLTVAIETYLATHEGPTPGQAKAKPLEREDHVHKANVFKDRRAALHIVSVTEPEKR
jgi:hypothetical protein